MLPCHKTDDLFTWVDAFVRKPASGGITNAILGKMKVQAGTKPLPPQNGARNKQEDNVEVEESESESESVSEMDRRQEVIVGTDEG